MDSLVRTQKLKLEVSEEEKQKLRQVSETYKEACNFVSNWIFKNKFQMNFVKVHEALYRGIRTRFKLNSQLAQSCIKTAISKYKTVQEQMLQQPKKRKVLKSDGSKNNAHPEYVYETYFRTLDDMEKPVRFKALQCDEVYNRNYRIKERRIALTAMEGTIHCSFKATPNWDKLLGQGWQMGTGKIFYQKKKWYFIVPLVSPDEVQAKAEKRKKREEAKAVRAQKKEPLSKKENLPQQRKTRQEKACERSSYTTIVGIDRGLRFLLTTADTLGKTKFFSGKDIIRRRHQLSQKRKSLQECHTRNSFRRIRKMEHRESRWMADINHQLSKALVREYGRNTLFVLEDLTGISFCEENLSRPKHAKNDLKSWAFYQFEQFLSYKAEETGSAVIKVSPRYTSQRCPKCGKVLKSNRKHEKHEYICSCGFRTNDDRVGAMNLLYLGKEYVSGIDSPSIPDPSGNGKEKQPSVSKKRKTAPEQMLLFNLVE